MRHGRSKTDIASRVTQTKINYHEGNDSKHTSILENHF